MAELFIELFSEEIPAKLQIDARERIKSMINERLKKKEIIFTSSKSFSTPKRLVFVINGIPEKIDVKKKVIKGPKVGAPDIALDGFIKSNNLIEHVRADTAGSAEMISRIKDIKNAAIASTLSAETYGLEIIKKNIENEKGNLTRFLIMGKNIFQPEYGDKKYITSFLFKLKSKPAALYQSLGGFAINGVNLTKLQSYPEKNSFDSFFFLCDLDGHIEDPKVQKSLEELGLHCQDFHVLGVFEADKRREK